jgi:hypothetical protein
MRSAGVVGAARRRPLPADAEVTLSGRVEPLVLKGGASLKSPSAQFLADFEEDWRNHGREIFSMLRLKSPETYFRGAVALARIVRWDSEEVVGMFDRSLSPEEVMDRLEQRGGPEARKLFERFLKQLNHLQAKQLAEHEEGGDDEAE